MKPAKSAKLPWINSPLFDLGVFSFAWVPFYVAWEILTPGRPTRSCEITNHWECAAGIQAILAIVMFLNQIHRHYTLGLVYGDEKTFNKNRRLYIKTPAIVLAMVFPFAIWKLFPESPVTNALKIGLGLLLAITMVWNYYHTVMQKYGFLRMYAFKRGNGDALLDKKLLFAWFALVMVFCGHHYNWNIGLYIAAIGFQPAKNIMPLLRTPLLVLLVPVGLYTFVVSIRWVLSEVRDFSHSRIPRFLFGVSYILMAATFTRSLMLGVILFSLSHSIEYIGFLGLYVRRLPHAGPAKPWNLSGWVKHPLAANIVIACYVGVIYKLLGFFPAIGALAMYTILTDVLHFYFDGILWKMSDPEVRKAVLSLD